MLNAKTEPNSNMRTEETSRHYTDSVMPVTQQYL